MLAMALLSTDLRYPRSDDGASGHERILEGPRQSKGETQKVQITRALSRLPRRGGGAEWLGDLSGVSFGHVRRLRPFLPLGDFELHRIAFLQALVSLGTDRAVVDEDIRPIRPTDEAISLGVVEPLDGSFQSFHVPPLSARPLFGGPRGRASQVNIAN